MTKSSAQPTAPEPETVSVDFIFTYLDVLDRQAEANEIAVLYLTDEEQIKMMTEDAKVLRDLRYRVWRQFSRHLVDSLN